MDVTARIHEQLTKCGIRIAASLPDDWVAPLIERIAGIRFHVQGFLYPQVPTH